MKTCKKTTLSVFSMLFLIGMLMVVVSPVMAVWQLVWEAGVPASGVGVVSPVLGYGEQYRIVAMDRWWYDNASNLAADAQYYTTNYTDSWNWVVSDTFPAPAGHSFLQINDTDKNWGPFSNGDTGHTYVIYYIGEGAALNFSIVDWIDGNYTDNSCTLLVRIFETVTVGGYVVDFNPLEIITLWTIGALTLAVVITVPIVKHWRKNRRRIG